METYISILRGINVAGQKLIKMDALRKSYERLGYQNVRTYVQSGNVIFTCQDVEIASLEGAISRQIVKDFGYEVPVMVLTANALKQLIDANPFAKDMNKNPAHLHVTFLSAEPGPFDMKAIDEKRQPGEEIHMASHAVYLYCPKGYGKTKLNNSYLESILKATATTRNWNTTNALLRLANEI
jgi:uncharacterized protein (DUF1697 family)